MPIALRVAVLVDRRPGDDRQHRMPIALRVAEPLEHQHRGAFPPPGAIGVGRERLTTPVGGQPALPGELGEDRRRGHHGGAPGQSQRRLAVEQGLTGQVGGHQRGRAGRVDRDRRALQTQRVGDPPGGHTRRRTRQAVSLHGIGPARAVSLRPRSDEHPGVRTDQPGRIDARGLQRFPAHLQQQPLLRIHALRLAPRDPEKVGVKPGRIGQESPGARVGLAHRIRIGVEQVRQIPAPVGRELPHRIDAPSHQLPQPRRRIHPTGKPAGHPHHRDRFVHSHLGFRRRGGRGRPAQQLTQVGGQLVGGRVVEGQRERQIQLGDGVEPVEQLGRLDRVKPQIQEGELGVDAVRGGMAQHRCRLRAHLGHQQLMVLLAQCAKSLGQSRVGLRNRVGGIGDGLPLQRADRLVYPGELVVLVHLQAVPPPDFAARGQGNRTGSHQNEIRHTQTVRFRYRRGDITPDGEDSLRRSLFGFFLHLEFDDGDQLLDAFGVGNRYRHAAVSGDRLDRLLDVIRRVVAPVDNQKILHTADEEQLTLREEAQVPGSQPGRFGCAGRRIDKRCAEGTFGLFGLLPIAAGDVVAVYPELTDPSVGLLGAGFGVDDTHGRPAE